MSKNDDLVRRELTIAELQTAHIERQEEWCPEQKPDLSFRGNEMAGEVGEACNVIKKLERERQGWRGSRATKAELSEELADVVHTAVLCAITAGIELQAAIVDKFNATSEKNGLSTMLSDVIERGAAQGVTDEMVVDAAGRLIMALPSHAVDAVNSSDILFLDVAREVLGVAFTAAPPAPQAADNERIVSSAIKEYELVDNLAGEHENMGRKAAVRGMMVRLGLYAAFNEALDAGDDEPRNEAEAVERADRRPGAANGSLRGERQATATPPAPAPDAGEEDAKLVAQLRRLVDEQTGGDALVLVQRQLFNKVVGRLVALSAPTPQPPAVEAEAMTGRSVAGAILHNPDMGDALFYSEAAIKAKTDEIERWRTRATEAESLWAFWNDKALQLAKKSDAAEASNKALREGLEPTDEMLDSVRHIFMWLGNERPTESLLLEMCKRRRLAPPKGCRDIDHVPNKRTLAYWIYLTMIEASPFRALLSETGGE